MCIRDRSRNSLVAGHVIPYLEAVHDDGARGGARWAVVRAAVPVGTRARGRLATHESGRMARRAFQVIDVVEVLQHWHAGRPKTVVAASLGVDVKTIRKYVAAAEAEGIRPGDGLVSDRAGWAARVAAWFPELVDAQARSRTWPELEGRRELITKMIETNTLATVHQRLRDEHGVAASESSLRRYVGQAFGGPPIAPGDGAAAGRAGREAQIDYGYLGSWVDPVGGRLRRGEG